MPKVWAKNELIRKYLKHLPSRRGLGERLADGADWPDDKFTTRRLKDGDILLQPPPADEINKSVAALAQAEKERKEEETKFLAAQQQRIAEQKTVSLKAESLTVDVPAASNKKQRD